MIIRIGDYWEQLVDDSGEVIAEGHKLDVEDVLWALGIKYTCEEIENEAD